MLQQVEDQENSHIQTQMVDDILLYRLQCSKCMFDAEPVVQSCYAQDFDGKSDSLRWYLFSNVHGQSGQMSFGNVEKKMLTIDTVIEVRD